MLLRKTFSWPVVASAVRLVAFEIKVTYRPLSSIRERLLSAFPRMPRTLLEQRSMDPVCMFLRKTCMSVVVCPSMRLVAWDEKQTYMPPALMSAT